MISIFNLELVECPLADARGSVACCESVHVSGATTVGALVCQSPPGVNATACRFCLTSRAKSHYTTADLRVELIDSTPSCVSLCRSQTMFCVCRQRRRCGVWFQRAWEPVRFPQQT